MLGGVLLVVALICFSAGLGTGGCLDSNCKWSEDSFVEDLEKDDAVKSVLELDVNDRGIVREVEEGDRRLKSKNRDFMSKIQTENRNLPRALETNEELRAKYEQLSSKLQLMNESLVDKTDKLNSALDQVNEAVKYIKSYSKENNRVI